MKHLYKRTVLLTLILLASLSGVKNTLAADIQVSPMLFPLYVETSQALLNEQGSLNIDHTNSVRKFKSITSKKATWISEYSLQKNYSKPNSAYALSQSVATSTYRLSDTKSLLERQTNTIVNKNNAYISFPVSGAYKVAGKWIEVPYAQYKEFGIKTGTIDELELSIQDTSSARDRAAKKVIAAYNKHKFYVPAKFDDTSTGLIPNSTRYDYLVNDTTLIDYYKELSETLTEEEQEYTLLDIEGFEAALKKKKYLTTVSEYSYASIWIDKTTLQPVYLHEHTLFQDPIKKKEAYEVMQRTFFGEQNSTIVSTPDKFITAKEAAKLLNFSLDPSLEESFTYLDEQIKELNVTKSNEDKTILASVIAYGYQTIGSKEKAAKYYTLAATFAETELERFVYLAKNELVLGNGKKAKEYFENAYKIDPDDYFVQFEFGDFLNGNTAASAKYKNLTRALELNEGWEDELRDDGNLLSLYVNYILLKQFNDAKKLEAKFESFDSPSNYMAIARAYHQIGDAKMSKKYQDLAEDAAYTWLPEDSLFFALKFKKGKLQTQ